MQIVEVNPHHCIRWKYADRSQFEFGNIDALAESIKKHGQIEPVYLRKCKDAANAKYEVIAGSRRWKACLNYNLKLKALIIDVSDYDASIIQIKENYKMDLSEYSKGMSFAKLKDDKKISQEQLAEIAGCSRRKIQGLLAFEKVEQKIWDAVHNMSKVSSRSAETIYALQKKSDLYKNALIEISDDIRKGAGCKRIEQLVNKKVLGEELEDIDADIIQSPSGQVFATWHNGKLTFSKSVQMDKSAFNNHLLEFFLKNKNQS